MLHISSLSVLYPTYLGKIALLSHHVPPPPISSKLPYYWWQVTPVTFFSASPVVPFPLTAAALCQHEFSNSSLFSNFPPPSKQRSMCVCVCGEIHIKLTILTTSQCKVQWHCKWGKICSHTPGPTGVKSPGPVVLGGGLFPQGSWVLALWVSHPVLSLYLPAWVLLCVLCSYQQAPSYPSC